MKKNATLWTVTATTLTTAVSVFIVSCGGGGSSSSSTEGAQTTIDLASVTSVIPAVSAVVPICDAAATAVAKANAASVPVPTALAALPSVLPLGVLVPPQFAGSRPSESVGPCGGSVSYPSYSHLSGTTTATLAFAGYCFKDASTGNTTTIDGSVPFVNTGTPTAFGPITSKLTADSPSGVSVVVKDASTKVISSQVYTFSGLVYTPGAPGSTPTSVKPDTYTLGELTAANKLTGKSYRHTGYTLSTYGTLAGGQKFSVNGRGQRSNGEYFDVSTTVPLENDAIGNVVGGLLTFAGAGSSSVVATLLPGSALQATLQVNGSKVVTGTACK